MHIQARLPLRPLWSTNAPGPASKGDGFRASEASDPGVYTPNLFAVDRDYQAKLPAIERLTSLENIEPQARQAICRDLSVLPRPVLELLAEDGLRVVAVAPGQELADTGYYTSPDPGRYGQMLDQGRDLFEREAAAVKAEQIGRAHV